MNSGTAPSKLSFKWREGHADLTISECFVRGGCEERRGEKWREERRRRVDAVALGRKEIEN
jgi:hypothetical protein